MGLHMLASLAKFNLLLPPTCRTATPWVTFMICPFVLKLSFSVRVIRRTYTDVVHASRLFFFQLSQIVFDGEPAPAGDSTRLERALRLVYQRVTRARRSPTTQTDEDNFHALSMFSL